MREGAKLLTFVWWAGAVSEMRAGFKKFLRAWFSLWGWWVESTVRAPVDTEILNMNISSATAHTLLNLLLNSDPAQEPWFFWVDEQGEIYLEPLSTYGLNFARWEKIQGHRSKFRFGTLPSGCVGATCAGDTDLAEDWLARLRRAWDRNARGYVSSDLPVGR